MKKIIVAIIVILIICTSTVFGAKFSDTEGHWAEKVVDEMATKGILNGFGDGTFKPNASVTREQFAKILVEALKINENDNKIIFQDVEVGRWSKDYIERASIFMTVGKTNDGRRYFMPEENAEREEVATAVVKASGLENETPNYDLLKQFSDSDKIKSDNKKYIAIAVEYGIMKGKGGYFDPQGELTRAEASQLLFNVFENNVSSDAKVEDGIRFNNNVNLYNKVKASLEKDNIEFEYDDKQKIINVDVKKVTKLSIYGNEVKDISQLSEFKYLQSLSLGTTQVEDISALSELTGLTYLTLGSNKIKDISSLSNLTNLRQLTLSNNEITNVKPLSKLTNLFELRLDGNNLSNINGLSNLTNLNVLYLYENELENINELHDLTRLTYLDIHDNKLTNLDALSTSTNLKYLSVYENKINDFKGISKLTKLESLILRNNCISDMSNLPNVIKVEGMAEPAEGSEYGYQIIEKEIKTSTKTLELPPIFENQQLKLTTNGEIEATVNNNIVKIKNASANAEIKVQITNGDYKGSTIIYTVKGKVEQVDDELTIYGDVNEDGKVDYIDAELVEKYPNISSNEKFNSINADVNLDNKINDVDAFFIQVCYRSDLVLPHKCLNYTLDYPSPDYFGHNIRMQCVCFEAFWIRPDNHHYENGKCIECGYIEDGVIYGDLNGNANIEIEDYEMIKSYLNGDDIVIPEKNADVDCDGKVTENDEWLIKIVAEGAWVVLPHRDCIEGTKLDVVVDGETWKLDDEKHIRIETCLCGDLWRQVEEKHTFIDKICSVCGAYLNEK